jgi:ankyrin repeat protein
VDSLDYGHRTPLAILVDELEYHSRDEQFDDEYLSCIKLLIDHGVQIKRDLFKSAIIYHPQIARYLLEINRDFLDYNYESYPLLFYLINKRYTNIQSFKLLLEYGVDLNQKMNSGMTPLMYASECGLTHIINFLINNGALVNDIDNEGNTALHYIEENIYNKTSHIIATAEILLQCGADSYLKNNKGQTAKDINPVLEDIFDKYAIPIKEPEL